VTKSPLPGIKTLLIGDSGTGKTYCLRTLIDAGLHPLCIFTENSFDVLGDVPSDKLSWVYIPPTRESLDDLRKQVKSIGTMSFEALTKQYDPSRFTESPLDKILAMMMEYKDERSGNRYGNISSWSTGICFVIDSLSGLSKASWQNVAGTRVALSPADYQLAQRQVENLVNQLTLTFRCHVVVTAHAEKELDPVNGGMKIYPSLPGKALAPVIGRYFTDVILTQRNGRQFTWNTIEPGAALKARNVGYAADLPPSFVPLIEQWKKRGGIIEPIQPTKDQK
jgi:hypothetical protein